MDGEIKAARGFICHETYIWQRTPDFESYVSSSVTATLFGIFYIPRDTLVSYKIQGLRPSTSE